MNWTSDNILVGGLEQVLFSHILGISSSQLTNIFQRGSNHQPDINGFWSRCFCLSCWNGKISSLRIYWHFVLGSSSKSEKQMVNLASHPGCESLSIYWVEHRGVIHENHWESTVHESTTMCNWKKRKNKYLDPTSTHKHVALRDKFSTFTIFWGIWRI